MRETDTKSRQILNALGLILSVQQLAPHRILLKRVVLRTADELDRETQPGATAKVAEQAGSFALARWRTIQQATAQADSQEQ